MSSLCLIFFTFVPILLSVALQVFLSSLLLLYIYVHFFQIFTPYPQDLIRLQVRSVVKIKFTFFWNVTLYPFVVRFPGTANQISSVALKP
jgi:hypothetical protein